MPSNQLPSADPTGKLDSTRATAPIGLAPKPRGKSAHAHALAAQRSGSGAAEKGWEEVAAARLGLEVWCSCIMGFAKDVTWSGSLQRGERRSSGITSPALQQMNKLFCIQLSKEAFFASVQDKGRRSPALLSSAKAVAVPSSPPSKSQQLCPPPIPPHASE